MEKTKFKSFDIATLDIELEYNSKIAPIKAGIEKLNKNYEAKSLKAYKDFLSKENQSKEKLALLIDKAILRDQRIEKAVENKLVKLRTKEDRFNKEYEEYKAIQEAEFNIKFAEIDEIIKKLETSKNVDINDIKHKYDLNVKSYVEKLNTYNDNHDNNNLIHNQQVIEYDKLLITKLAEISEMKNYLDENIGSKLSSFMKSKDFENNEINQSWEEIERDINNQTKHIRMDSNVKIKDIKVVIDELHHGYTKRYEDLISNVNEQISILETKFLSRKNLIEKDLEINLNKLDEELTQEKGSQTKKTKKSVNMKIELFNLRASTTIKYEERILNEKILIIKKEIEFAKETLDYELSNLQKLEVFLLSDQNELKELGEYFKTINLTLKNELKNFELTNNDYIVKHEKLKSEFVNNYAILFEEFKNELLVSNKSSIDQLTEINQEIDEINKYLDTSDSLKEIKVNRLREAIEANEVKEKYNIRFAEQQHSIQLLNNQLENLLDIEMTNVKDKIFENDEEISNIRNKEVLDKDLGKSKLKNEKDSEVNKLHLNSTKLELSLLSDKYEKELKIFEFEKEIAKMEVYKNDILITKEVNMEIESINLEANYKIEVINKRLEEDLLKLNEEVDKYTYEQDSISSLLDIEISKEKLKSENEINIINSAIDKKLSLIKEALDREIKDPSISLTKSQEVINEKLAEFEISNSIYDDFIEESANLLSDDTLEIEQIKQIASNSDNFISETMKYIQKSFESLEEAQNFMNELEIGIINQKISITTNSGAISKLKKTLQKLNIDINKKTTEITNSKSDHEINMINRIKSDLAKFDKSKIKDVETLKNNIKAIYSSSYTALKALQVKLLAQVDELYAPIIKSDNELIENAEKNSQKAISFVEEERIKKIAPFEKTLKTFTTEVEARRKIHVDVLDIDITKFRNMIKTSTDKADDEVKVIKDIANEAISVKSDYLETIEKNEESEIVKLIEVIDAKKIDLDNIYNETVTNLNNKDLEANNIFDYEGKIHSIADNTANYRYNDSLNKTKHAHLLKIKDNNKNRNIIVKDAENHIKQIDKELVDITSKFEKTIFTTRPRLEESIRGAQKSIDKEIRIKENRLKELLEVHQKASASLESNLDIFFQEGYEKLLQNLSVYLEKYKIIIEDYNSDTITSINVVSENSTIFANSLFEQGKNKHNATQKKLIEINTNQE